VLPVAALLMQSGATPNILEYLKILSDYADLPELGRIVESGEPLAGAGMSLNRMAKPASSSREYVRRQAKPSALEASEAALQRAGRNGAEA
jgi:hypothetical protein